MKGFFQLLLFLVLVVYIFFSWTLTAQS